MNQCETLIQVLALWLKTVGERNGLRKRTAWEARTQVAVGTRSPHGAEVGTPRGRMVQPLDRDVGSRHAAAEGCFSDPLSAYESEFCGDSANG